MADNEEDRKLFVGGLPQEVSQDDLKEYFGAYGEIESVKLKMDPMTGRSRGFAFLLYKDEESIDNAADIKDHKLKVFKLSIIIILFSCYPNHSIFRGKVSLSRRQTLSPVRFMSASFPRTGWVRTRSRSTSASTAPSARSSDPSTRARTTCPRTSASSLLRRSAWPRS